MLFIYRYNKPSYKTVTTTRRMQIIFKLECILSDVERYCQKDYPVKNLETEG